MPISTYWYDETQQIIFQRYEGHWTWEDLSREQEKLRELANSVPYDVVLFSDMSQTSFMPQGNVLAQGRTSFTTLPDNIPRIVIVIQSRMIEVFTRIALDMFPTWRDRVKFVKTLAEGERLVAAAIGEFAPK